MRAMPLQLSAACLFTGLLSLTAGAQVIEWEPVHASGDHTIIGNEIVLAGGGQLVTLHMKLSGWDPDQIGETLGSYQAAIDPSHYLGANASPPNPGVDLNPYGWPISPSDGIFQALQVCVETLQFPDVFDPLSTCTSSTATEDCGPFPAGCVDRPDFVFAGVDFVPTVTTTTLAYTMGAATVNCATDPDGGVTKFYGGTLIIEVPVGARGTYTVGFDESPDYTLMTNCVGIFMSTMTRVPAQISIACGSDEDCDDGNECTDDACISQVCSNIPNYDDATYCCDPAVGPPAGLTVIDDGNECTNDICDPADGSVDYVPLTGQPCGDPPGGECDAQDTCDASGACVDNHAPAGTPCGDPIAIDPECDGADACDGQGVCDSNFQPAGTPCGDDTDTDCTDPDICDGAGSCDPNHEPNGTTCDDLNACTANEYCTDGLCGSGDGVDCD
ncbi:MAG: hypothetical protein JSU63_18210, partial [Phycisphaerales bacterium]